MMSKLASLGRQLALGSAIAAPFVYVGFRYRPLPSTEDDRARPIEPEGVHRWLYSRASSFAVILTSYVLGGILRSGNKLDIVDLDKLHRAILERPEGVPLVTVANHASMLDDPGLMSVLLPTEVIVNPERGLRWGVCTENICFTNPLHGMWIGLGRGLPIRRGGSIYQKGVATLQAKVNKGDWVHVFAEGRVWQDAGTPARDSSGRWCLTSGRCGPPNQRIAPLKWGVGKIIANAAVLPIIVPTFHWGMGDVGVQNEVNEFIALKPWTGALITAIVGDPVNVSDLIAAYHEGARARAQARNAAREAALRAARAPAWWRWTLGLLPAVSLSAPKHRLQPTASEVTLQTNTDQDVSDHTGASAHVAGISHVVVSLPSTADPVHARAAELVAELRKAGIIPPAAPPVDAHGSPPISSASACAFTNSVSANRPEPVRVPLSDIPEEFSFEWWDRWVASARAATQEKLNSVETALIKELKASEEAIEKAAVAAVRRVENAVAEGEAAVAKAAGAALRTVRGSMDLDVKEPTDMAAISPKGVNASIRSPKFSRLPNVEDSVVEFVPPRTLSTGVRVPAYTEAPLRSKPPDHEFLSPLEAAAEEDFRLKLYSDIAQRIEDALADIERRVFERRRQMGWVERRPMT